jgi:hypothetical protein
VRRLAQGVAYLIHPWTVAHAPQARLGEFI